MNSDDTSPAIGAINLSIKPVGSDENEKYSGVGNIGDNHENPTSDNSSIVVVNDHYEDTPDSVSDVPSENLLTGKPVVYLKRQEGIASTSGVPGINSNTPKECDTLPQGPETMSEQTVSEQSITNGINIVPENNYESGTNISQEPNQPAVLDPYTDAPLSGTLERIHMDDNMLNISVKDISHHVKYQNDSLIDHNYPNPSCISAAHSVKERHPTQLTIDPDGNLEIRDNSYYTEVSQENDSHSAQDDVDNIETEIVSMECIQEGTGMYTTGIQENFTDSLKASECIPGTNVTSKIMQKTSDQMDATAAALKEISISYNSCVASGTNIDSHHDGMMGSNIVTLSSSNNTDLIGSDPARCDYKQADNILGIKTNKSSSGESSDFEGFTSADLETFNRPGTYSTAESSSIMSTDNYSYEDAVEDSSDTVPAIDPVDESQSTGQKLSPPISKDQNSDSILPGIMQLWEKDAMKKKWTVPLRKLTPTDI